MNKEIWILGLYIDDRIRQALQVQSILTKFGSVIRTRLGLHNTDGRDTSSSGLMILELNGDPSEFLKLENELLMLEGVEVKKMIFRQG